MALQQGTRLGAYEIISPIGAAFTGDTMTLRISKACLVAAVALYYTLVVLNNCTDYGTNYQFVRHVMMMDTTFPGNHGMWRAIHSPFLHKVFYDGIIAWEAVTMVLCWLGSLRMLRALRGSVAAFHKASRVAVAGLTLGLLMWLVAFLAIGGEWFLMWQSQTWNGQAVAFGMFTVTGVVLVLVLLPEREIPA
jgi:predicted small integral membrane protein